IVGLQYDDGFGWPRRADGGGSTLEVVDPTGDPNDGVNWRASEGYGGSPGRRGAAPRSDILINEVLARSGVDEEDRVELFNASSRTIDVSGWYLSSDANNLAAHALPAGTTLDAGQYVVLSSSQTGLTLDGSQGDDLWLMEGGPNGVPTRFADHVTFQATPVGESLGRWPNGDAEARLFPMKESTFGEANSGPRPGAVVLSEVHFAPQPLAIAGIDFSDDRAGGLQTTSGDWRIEGGRYHATPDANGDAVALLPEIGALLSKTRLSATITVPAVTDFNKNALLVFDYQGPADFKFVSIHTGSGRFRIGQRIEGRWEFLDQVDQSVASGVPIPVSVVLDGTVARLSVFNFERVSYDFGEPLNDGLIGLATKNGEAFFDDVVVETPRDVRDFEFVELVNTASSAVDLNGWQLSGGIEFAFTENRPVDAGGVVVVVSFDPRSDTNFAADFRQRMGIDSSVPLAGPFLGDLSDTSDRIELLGPVDAAPAGDDGLMLVDRVAYKTESPWPTLATAQGKSLHRVAADRYGDLASSWWVSGASAGSAQFARPGDLDRNGVVDQHDIGAFALALTDPSAYEQTYGAPARLGGDFDADGDVDFDDIEGLVGLIQQQTSDSQAARAVDAVMNDLDGP
ncbi:MAG: lamin tail domain-containing protein, partial [Pirellulales bacterium]